MVPARAAVAELWQARNGSADSPQSPVEWVKGNAGPANSHFVEGHSIPYRLVISGLSTGRHALVLEWDTKQGGKHAIDFLTHYNRLRPHQQFQSHAEPEVIDPLLGLVGSFDGPLLFPLPVPSSVGSPIPGQPASAFSALPPAERSLAIWNGKIISAQYEFEGSLTNDSASSRILIEFIAVQPTVVMVLGGHIASHVNWGADNAAAGINGSPYHMRLISLDGAGGRQDRSLQAQAIIVPPTCEISGTQFICPGSVHEFTVSTDATNAAIRWSLAANTSGAQLSGPLDGRSVTVIAGDNGHYSVEVSVWTGQQAGTSNHCAYVVEVIASEPPQIVCPPDLVIAENPRNSGTGVAEYVAESLGDSCDPAPVVVCEPQSGSPLPTGITTVTCTAIGRSGNATNCSFQAKVVPYLIVVASLDDSGPGTLRQALLDANSSPGANLIHFRLGRPAPHTIALLSPLPALTEPVIIDGYSQSTDTSKPVIELNGTATASDGLVLIAASNAVRGLVLYGFEIGIRIEGAGGNRIEGCFIGTDATGIAGPGNRGEGIHVSSSGNIVGGVAAGMRNIIAGNGRSGILLESSSAIGNQVLGNYIGVSADLGALGNAGDGIRIKAGARFNQVGTATAAGANIISHNRGNGISIESSESIGNAVRGNAIFGNDLLGIDLGDDGSTGNDPGDPDTGPNTLQNSPVLVSARSDAFATVIAGLVNGSPHAVMQVDFFINSPEGGYAQLLLGSVEVKTDAEGNGAFDTAFARPSSITESVIATATDADGNTSEFSGPVPILTPPIIVRQPVGTNVPPGGSVTLCVDVIGSQPILYQWRKNGANIPDETNACLVIPSADLNDGGRYTVVVANELGAVVSDPALVLLIVPTNLGGDDFADRTLITGTNGLFFATNTVATSEPGEPLHAGKPGGRSVWYSWTAPATGIATIRTVGSLFDTLLGIYTGSSVENLSRVASDEDRGGFYTSMARFNALAGTNYYIAVDAFGGLGGEFIFSFEFEATPKLLPVIIQEPIGVTVPPGGTAIFAVDAIPGCRDGHHDGRHSKDHHEQHPEDVIPLFYQWYFNGGAILGATNSTLIVSDVQDEDLGNYFVRITANERQIDSLPATLQINLTGDFVQNVQASDKFLDAANAQPLTLGDSPQGVAPSGGGPVMAASTIVRGYTGTQAFNTSESSTESTEQLICGVPGGASQWVTFVAQESGLLYLNTDGSSYNTVMAVYRRSPANPAVLQQMVCDNNSGLDGRDSALSLRVQAGSTNFVVVDGVNGATGTLRLNYSLVTGSTLIAMGNTSEGHPHLRVTGRPAMRFSLEVSADGSSWTTLVTTNSLTGIADYLDTRPTDQPKRFYRALMLP